MEGEADGLPPKAPARRLRWRIAGIGLGVLTLLGAGWGAAVAFQSPAQVAARAAAPPPKAVTASVSRGDLARTVSLKATVQREKQYDASLQPGTDQREVTTAVPKAIGSELEPLAVFLEVNGRPRFVVAGSFPFYRTMHLGDTGPDVKQLQSALSAAGYAMVADGYFGAQTVAAMGRVYAKAGYPIPVPEAASSSQPAAPSDRTAPRPDAAEAAFSLPPSEFLVFPSLPAILQVTPPLGAVLSVSSVVSVSTGSIVAAGSVDPATAIALKPGMKATVQGVDAGTAAATLTAVESAPSAGEPDPTKQADTTANEEDVWTVRLAFQEPPSTWLGTDVLALITISVAASDSLIVPTVAVVSGGADKPHVLKKMPDGTFKSIAVEESGVLAGRSAVAPITKDELRVGDVVKVG